jgi:uncharacterized membrane protein (Fun14 family)
MEKFVGMAGYVIGYTVAIALKLAYLWAGIQVLQYFNLI